ncbi:MAG: hypothetical protein FWD24_03470 [Treponema sp.]|nr:hypothetical protein [Treponema sp.]
MKDKNNYIFIKLILLIPFFLGLFVFGCEVYEVAASSFNNSPRHITVLDY